jgi:hypothetical protein
MPRTVSKAYAKGVGSVEDLLACRLAEAALMDKANGMELSVKCGGVEETCVQGRRIGAMSIDDIVAVRDGGSDLTADERAMLSNARLNRLIGEASRRMGVPSDIVQILVFRAARKMR